MSRKLQNVVILGAYVDEATSLYRGLPSSNVATSNRIFAFANALKKSGLMPRIIAPAVSLRMFREDALFVERSKLECAGIEVVYPKCVAIPLLGLLFGVFSTTWEVLKYCQRRKNCQLLVVNYTLPITVAAVIARFACGIPVVFDVEDLCVPRVDDWLGKGDNRPIFQLIGWLQFKVVLAIADVVFVPTSRFVPYVESCKRVWIVSGCVEQSDAADAAWSNETSQLVVVFSGSLTKDNGVELFAEALRIIEKKPSLAKRFQFHISGAGEMSEWLNRIVESLVCVDVKFHGMLASDNYRTLLNSAQVGLALQSPYGRHANFKVPSKVYELMANRKAVVLTKVGDFNTIPAAACARMEVYNAEALVKILNGLSFEQAKRIANCGYIYANKNWSYSNFTDVFRDAFQVKESLVSIV